jgi:hypothetical protein
MQYVRVKDRLRWLTTLRGWIALRILKAFSPLGAVQNGKFGVMFPQFLSKLAKCRAFRLAGKYFLGWFYERYKRRAFRFS